MSDAASVPQVGPQQCPKCNEKAAKAATVTQRFVYLRCSLCAEVWVIPERREFERDKGSSFR